MKKKYSLTFHFLEKNNSYLNRVETIFFLRSSSLNVICLYLKQKKLGFTAGRCLILHALARA